jgi:hypothetical protein
MKDFRQAPNTRSIEEQERSLERKRRALQILGALITAFCAVAAAAYFSDLAVLPFLEDRDVALKYLIASGIALVLESVATGWLIVRIARLKRSREV